MHLVVPSVPKTWNLQLGRTSDVLVCTLLVLLTTLTVIEVHERSHGYGLGRRSMTQVAPWGQQSDASALQVMAGTYDQGGRNLEDDNDDDTPHVFANPPVDMVGQCQVEPHAEYPGEVVEWGTNHLQPSAASCCEACALHPRCRVWVWCSMLSGCGPERLPLPTGSLGTMGTHKYRECWLKTASLQTIINEQGFSHPDVGWTSGSAFAERAFVEAQERARLEALRNNPALPLVYLDISIRGRPAGRIEIVLFKDAAPLAAENFRALCTGERGMVPSGKQGAGTTYSFKGRAFYRIVDRFVDQSGANTESIYGGSFKDDPGGLALKHDRKGLLSMVNAGPDSNTSHFSILMGPAAHLDGKYVVFGEIVSGMDVAHKINALARARPGGTAGLDAEAIISGAGQLRR